MKLCVLFLHNCYFWIFQILWMSVYSNICYIILHDVSIPCVVPCFTHIETFKHTILRRALLRYLVLLHSNACLSSNGMIRKACIHLRQYTSPIITWSSLNRLCGSEYLWCWGCNLPICFGIFQSFVPSPDSHPKNRKEAPMKAMATFQL